MLIDAKGATGACYSFGCFGGWVQASLSVLAGQTLSVYIGGSGRLGGFNGGGGGRFKGGGASDIRTISGDLRSRLIVAGGGGGREWAGGGIVTKYQFFFFFPQ